KSAHSSEHQQEFKALQRAFGNANVRLLDAVLTQQQTKSLMKSADCYVSLHRSEGFGLTMAEAMLMRKPVIATGYSGNLDFMTPDTSLLVPYHLVSLKHDIPPYKKGYIWADPSLAEAARWMRWVYEHPREAQALGAKAQQHVRRVLSPEAAAQRMAQRFEEIQQLRAAVPGREKGTSLNSTSLTPKSL